jgi:hypothetical protein
MGRPKGSLNRTLSIRLTEEALSVIQSDIDELQKENPGLKITKADAVRRRLMRELDMVVGPSGRLKPRG